MIKISDLIQGVFDHIEAHINDSMGDLPPFEQFLLETPKMPDRSRAVRVLVDRGTDDPVESTRSQGSVDFWIFTAIRSNKELGILHLRYLDVVREFWNVNRQWGMPQVVVDSEIVEWDVSGGTVQGSNVGESGVTIRLKFYG